MQTKALYPHLSYALARKTYLEHPTRENLRAVVAATVVERKATASAFMREANQCAAYGLREVRCVRMRQRNKAHGHARRFARLLSMI